MQSLLKAGRTIGQSLGQMLAQQVTNTKARERLAATVLKQIGVCRIFIRGGYACDQLLYELRRPRPDRAEPHLVTFAKKTHLTGWIEAHVTDFQIENLLYTGTGIEHKDEQGVVTPTSGSLLIDAAKQRLYLVRLQIVDRHSLRATFEWDAEHTLAVQGSLGT